MAYIKVNIDRLRGFNASVEDILKNTVRISDDFMSIGRRLDWDILVNTRVQKDLDRLEDQFGTERASLKKMTEFFNFAVTSYVSMEKENQEAVPEETDNGSGLATKMATGISGKPPEVTAIAWDVNPGENKETPTVEPTEEAPITNTLGASFGGRNQGNDAEKKADTIVNVFSGVANFGAKVVNKMFGQVVSGITGFSKLIWNTAKNAEDRVSDLERIENDETLTDDEKTYMSSVTEHLSNVEGAFDALGWVVGMVPVVGGTLSKAISAIGDGIDSEGVKSEFLEGTREIEEAKKDYQEADTFLEKTGAALNVAGEYIEAGCEIGKEIVNNVVDAVDKAVVQPIKDVGNSFKNGFSWLGNKLGLW